MRKIVKNGFIDVVESQAASTFHNPSTHEQDRVMKRQWTFSPSMLPDGAEMPRSIEGWDEAFAAKGRKLPPISTFVVAKFQEILKTCENMIEAAYKEMYEPEESPAAKALKALGFK